MPRKNIPSIEDVLAAVATVSIDFARVAELARFGLAVQQAADQSGYEMRRKSTPRASKPSNGAAEGVGIATTADDL